MWEEARRHEAISNNLGMRCITWMHSKLNQHQCKYQRLHAMHAVWLTHKATYVAFVSPIFNCENYSIETNRVKHNATNRHHIPRSKRAFL